MPFPDPQFIKSFKINNPNSIVTALDYSDSTDSNINNVINLFDHPRMLPGKKENIRTKFFTGLQFAIIREDFHNFRISQKNIPQKVQNILISFGGADPSEYTYKLISRPELFNHINVSVTVGLNFQNKNKIANLELPENIKILGTVSNIEKFMLQADLIICGAGTTMLEAFFLGTPALVIPQTEDEMNFANFAKSQNLCNIANLNNIDNVLSKMVDAYSFEIRKKLSKNGMTLVDGNGAIRIADIVLGNN